MKLQLTRPLAFLDLETTGVDVSKDRIVEISVLKLMPDGSKQTYTQRVNPTIPIPAVTTAIHGISDADIEHEPTFKEISQKLFKMLYDSDLGGFNSNRFDVPVLVEEFFRADIVFDPSEKNLIDVQNIFHKMEQRTLVAAYRFYCDKDLTNAHSAEADTIATYEVFMAQMERYSDTLENDMVFLGKFSKQHQHWMDFAGRLALDEKGEPAFNFGKYKGRTIEAVLDENPGYYSWMMKGNFPSFTKKVLTDVRDAIRERKNSKEG